MKETLGFVALAAVCIPAFMLVVAIGVYVPARIMAPELGLAAPDYWACFWATLFSGAVATGLSLLRMATFGK